MNPLNQLSRIDQLKLLGVNPDVHSFFLNIQHAYTRFLNSVNNNERKEMWRYMHLLATDMATITEVPCPDIEKELYKDLAGE